MAASLPRCLRWEETGLGCLKYQKHYSLFGKERAFCLAGQNAKCNRKTRVFHRLNDEANKWCLCGSVLNRKMLWKEAIQTLAEKSVAGWSDACSRLGLPPPCWAWDAAANPGLTWGLARVLWTSGCRSGGYLADVG